jgi:cellulose synthase/poly-beta-1,6-N-acetylglucosamine synthase-like glycosyltransferase
MKVQVIVIVPVSAFEPLDLIKKSVECLIHLEKENYDVRITYVVDVKREDDRIFNLTEIAEEKGIKLLIRQNNRGRRAGALNDGINSLGNDPADFFAIFDIDSRPDADFLKECIKALEANGEAAVASGARYVLNENGIIPRIISAEYEILSYLYIFFSNNIKIKGFKHFNGLIGVIRGEVFEKERFNEEKMCEDVDMMDRIYLSGKNAVFVRETKLGEQAPITVRDLWRQRVRWFIAPLEELSSYLGNFIHTNAKITSYVKITWLLAMSMPFFIFLLSPLVPLYFLLYFLPSSPSHDAKDYFIKSIGLGAHFLLLQLCSFCALVRFVKNEKKWEKMKREVI